MSGELLPCPFCGKTPAINDGFKTGHFNYVEISCSHPVSDGPDGFDDGASEATVRADTEELAVAAWNRRAYLAASHVNETTKTEHVEADVLSSSPSEMDVRFPHSGMTTAEAVALIDSNTISGLRSRLEAADARIKALEEALRPFGEYLDHMPIDVDNNGTPGPDGEGVGWVYLTCGDFRRARSALKENAL